MNLLLVNVITYFKENPKYFWVLVASVALIILIAISIAVAVKRRKKAKVAASQAQIASQEEQSATEVSATKQEPVEEVMETPVVEENASAAEEKQPEKPAAKKAPAKKPATKKAVKKPAEKPVETPVEAPVEKPVAVKNEKKEEPVKLGNRGKWVIEEEDGSYTACLYANNGELMLRSEAYSSESGAKNGINTIKKNAEARNFVVKQDKNGNFYFKLLSGNNRLVCTGEAYSSRSSCESSIESVFRFCQTALLVANKKDAE